MIKDKNGLIPNSYELKARAENIFYPENENDIEKIFKDYAGKRIVVLGRGNNIILKDDYYGDDYVFVILRDPYGAFDFDGKRVVVQAGADMKQLSLKAMEKGLSGVEYFYGIPSSLGGAVYMNAGANEFETSQIVKKVKYFDIDELKIKEIENRDIGFSYRHSIFQELNCVILEAELQLNEGNKDEVWAKMKSIYDERAAKQPLDYPSAGSVFKRPKGYYVGKMVQDLGLKGYSIGGAKISEKHAGFIINYNNATGKDILQLIDFIRHKVKDAYGVWLETEQVII